MFSVRDNGIGIDPADAKLIFGMFKGRHGKEIPGTGIGLALCRKVVERQGGRIWVESEAGRGATFSLRFPRRSRVDCPPLWPRLGINRQAVCLLRASSWNVMPLPSHRTLTPTITASFRWYLTRSRNALNTKVLIGSFLTITLGRLMACAKHLMQADSHGPPKHTVYPHASRQSILDAVR